MANIKYRKFSADFETSVYPGQEDTEVWAAALVEIGTEDVTVYNSIGEFFKVVFSLCKKNNIKLYFHNLKFDGSFILDYFLRTLHLKQGWYLSDKNNPYSVVWRKDSKLLNNEFKYVISDMGQWYSMTVKVHNHLLQIVDSYKLLPFSVDRIGKSFGTKHKKLSIEYEGERHAGGVITPEECEYIKNDVLVVAEALQIMFEQGHEKLTIGSCCLAEYKHIIGKYDYKEMFLNMVDYKLDKNLYGSGNADEYIRKSFRGGWCYLARGKENRIYHNGITLDVNSLYPSMMSGESGNIFPVYEPIFWKGNYVPDEALYWDRWYVIRVRTSFELKPGMLPTIQIKNNLLYQRNEYLESSRIKLYGKYVDRVHIGDTEYDSRVTLTLTKTDWELMKDHYYLYDTEILDGCWFYGRKGIFDEYIYKYREIKMNSKGATRELAKLYLNNLYGKLAANPRGGFKVADLDEDGRIRFTTIAENEKPVVFIPCGTAITSYARNFTIRAAQANYYGPDDPGFIYSDTDSIHLDIPVDQVKGVQLSDTEFLKWKHESSWSEGWFTRQKTYIEHGDEWNVTACGMGKRCKELVIQSLEPDPGFNIRSPAEEAFLKKPFDLSDFRDGLEIPSNLKQKRITGGVVLMEDYFCLR